MPKMDKIKPALTAEEWAQEIADNSTADEWTGEGEGEAGLLNGDLIVGYDDGVAYQSVKERHRAAALALYGQAFGFTREMLRAIRHCAEFSGPDAESELAHEAADRIEALLPPDP
jgi:hypothetical protein